MLGGEEGLVSRIDINPTMKIVVAHLPLMESTLIHPWSSLVISITSAQSSGLLVKMLQV